MEHNELWAILAVIAGLAYILGMIWALRDLGFTKDLTGTQKSAWLLALFLSGFIGLAFYLALAGRQKSRNRRLQATLASSASLP